MNRKFEKVFPALSGAVVATIASCIAPLIKFEYYHDLFQAALSVGAINLGFLGVAQSIFFTLLSSPYIQELKTPVFGADPTDTAYHDILGYFYTAIRWSFVWMMLSLIFLVLTIEECCWQLHAIMFIWAGAGAISLTALYRITVIFNGLLRKV